MALAVAGCGPEPIVSYTVPRLQVATSGETRILAAIARLPEATWTIKASGAPAAIAAIEPAWQRFLASLQFAGNAEPQFTLPEQWRRSSRTGQFRDVILEVESVSPRLEVVFTRMPSDFDLAANVNRWRANQLGLPPITADELPNHLREQRVGDVLLLLFDATGNSAAGGGGMLPPPVPPAGAAASASPPASPPSDTPAVVDRLDMESPDGWEVGPTNPIVAGKFTKREGERTVELSVVALRADSPWEQTVQIWSDGLGLSPLTPEQVAGQTESRELAGQTARLIRLTAADGSRTTAIASLVRGPNNWIVKLTGDADLVTAEQTTWDRFLQSLRFVTPEQDQGSAPH